MEDQNWFLNCVVKVGTELSPRSLLDVVKEIELGMGRNGSNIERRFGPRIIDIDILFYDKQIVSEENLKSPTQEFRRDCLSLFRLLKSSPALFIRVTEKASPSLLADLHSEKKIVKL